MLQAHNYFSTPKKLQLAGATTAACGVLPPLWFHHILACAAAAAELAGVTSIWIPSALRRSTYAQPLPPTHAAMHARTPHLTVSSLARTHVMLSPT
eukprot:COSAG01_NODE_30_length_36127_cov_41.433234_23_plen_96_part_00